MPLISVIMPVYNAEQFLDCSVGSVLSQTFDDWELICFNDASTDNSISILDRYASTDPRIHVIDSPVNVKQGGGRNRGILAAKGKYVMFLDADDRLASPRSLAVCAGAIRKEHADMVLFDYEQFRGDGSAPVTVSPLGQNAAGMRSDILRRHLTTHPGPIWSAVYRRSLIPDNGLLFPENVFYEDNAVALAIQLSALNPVKINEIVYGYRVDNTSVTRSRNNYRFFHRLGSAITLKRHLVRLGLYDRWHEEIDFLLVNQYYVHTVYGCIYRFDRLPVRRLHYVTGTVDRIIPDFRDNPLYRSQSLKWKLKLALHTRFPRLIHALSAIRHSITHR